MTTELQAIDTGIPTGVGLRDPNIIMLEAKERCKTLTDMVEQTKSYTQIGPSKHLRVEAWITLAQFYGCSGRITRTEDIDIGGVVGFKAHAQVVHDQSGMILSSAEAICMKDERNWDSKPLHQLMSMAQTRALSKALAAKFRWVVTLGGFAPTPAEEMTGDEYDKAHAPVEQNRSRNARPEPVIPYGPAKGQKLSQAETGHLRGFLEGKQAAIKAGKQRPEYAASDKMLMDAIEAELAKRPAEPAANADPRGVFTDDAWTTFCETALEQFPDQLAELQAEKKIKVIGKVKPEYRWELYDVLQAKL
jgi:hypothetical protein